MNRNENGIRIVQGKRKEAEERVGVKEAEAGGRNAGIRDKWRRDSWQQRL